MAVFLAADFLVVFFAVFLVDFFAASQWQDVNATRGVLESLQRYFSPYELNPLGFDPLRGILDLHVNFDHVNACRQLAVHVTATHVRSGQARIFSRGAVTADAVMREWLGTEAVTEPPASAAPLPPAPEQPPASSSAVSAGPGPSVAMTPPHQAVRSKLSWNYVLATLPILIIYIFFQRYFVEGIAASGVKG